MNENPVSEITGKGLPEYIDDVSHPGKFEGEEPWTPYFYEIFLHGEGEPPDVENGPEDEYVEADKPDYWTFTVETDDAIVIPALEGYIGRELRLYENEQGFVHTEIVDAA